VLEVYDVKIYVVRNKRYRLGWADGLEDGDDDADVEFLTATR